jgi:hypothetical protein
MCQPSEIMELRSRYLAFRGKKDCQCLGTLGRHQQLALHVAGPPLRPKLENRAHPIEVGLPGAVERRNRQDNGGKRQHGDLDQPNRATPASTNYRHARDLSDSAEMGFNDESRAPYLVISLIFNYVPKGSQDHCVSDYVPSCSAKCGDSSSIRSARRNGFASVAISGWE